MRIAWTAALAVVGLLGCGEITGSDSDPSSGSLVDESHLAALSGTTEWTFSVLGETFGPGGALWTQTGSLTLCSTSQWVVDWDNHTHTIKFDKECGPSWFSGPNPEEYDGGIVNVSIDTDNGRQHLGWVSSRLSDLGTAYDIPVGAGIHLKASLNPGCQVSHWFWDTGFQYGGNTLYIPYGSAYGVSVRFYCSGM